jgi:hypothetical protein
MRSRPARDCMVIGFTTTYAISDYHHSGLKISITFTSLQVGLDIISKPSILSIHHKMVQLYFSYSVVVSFIGERNQGTRRKPPTCRMSLKTLSHNVVLSTPRHE